MVIIDDTPRYTDTDKENLVIRKYTESEIADNVKEYKKNGRFKRWFCMLLEFFSLVLTFVCEEGSQAAACIATIIFGFILVIVEIVFRCNFKIAKQGYYIELLVDKKIPIESKVGYVGELTSEMDYIYSIEGTDTASGYKALLYITKEEYLKSREGSPVRISLGSERFDD